MGTRSLNIPFYCDVVELLLSRENVAKHAENEFVAGMRETERNSYFWIYQCSNPICTKRRRTLICKNGAKVVEETNAFMRCKGCLIAVYCSKKCQKIHWSRYAPRIQCS